MVQIEASSKFEHGDCQRGAVQRGSWASRARPRAESPIVFAPTVGVAKFMDIRALETHAVVATAGSSHERRFSLRLGENSRACGLIEETEDRDSEDGV